MTVIAQKRKCPKCGKMYFWNPDSDQQSYHLIHMDMKEWCPTCFRKHVWKQRIKSIFSKH